MMANIQAVGSLLAFSVIALMVLTIIAIEFERIILIKNLLHMKIDDYILVEINAKDEINKNYRISLYF